MTSSSSSSSSADTTYSNRVIRRRENKSRSISSSSSRPSNLHHQRRRRRRPSEYLLLAPILKSLIPSSSTPLQPQPQPVEMREIINGVVGRVRGGGGGEAEVELDPHESLEGGDSSSASWSSWDEEMNPAAATITMTSSSSSISQQKKAFNQEEEEDEEDDDGGCCINVDFEEEEEEEDAIFKPSIKITKMDDDSIHINTIVMKEVSLTSTLFSVLEEEKLDIVFEDHYRTETKAAHSIQVRVQPGYNVDALETKLRSWAQCTI